MRGSTLCHRVNGVTARNGNLSTLSRFRGSLVLKKRSRIRLQLVLCDDWHGNSGCLVAQGLALLIKVRTLICEEDFAPYRALFSVSCAHPIKYVKSPSMQSEKCGVSREAAPADFPGLKILYTEAVEQWQEHITGTHPMSASLIVRLHR